MNALNELAKQQEQSERFKGLASQAYALDTAIALIRENFRDELQKRFPEYIKEIFMLLNNGEELGEVVYRLRNKVSRDKDFNDYPN